jgi:hypothetical protein
MEEKEKETEKKWKIKSFSYDSQDEIFKHINIKLLYDFGRIKKETDKKIDEVQSSFIYFREKE